MQKRDFGEIIDPTTRYVAWRDYVDARIDAVEREVRALEKAMDTRLRDAELNRNEGITRLVNLVGESVRSLEARVSEKFTERDKALDKAATVMDERMTQVYLFRDQISSERLSYVTRDHLTDALKSVVTEIDLLKRAVTLSAGKETGVSKTWAAIIAVISTLAAIISAIAAIEVFFRH